MLERFLEWLVEDLTWGGVLFAVGLFLATFTVSLLVVGFLLVKLPATYFLDSHNRDFWVDRHPLLRTLAHVGKNALGLLLMVVGVMLSLPGVPGQGILTILIGVMLVDFPGKRRLERKLVGRPKVLHAVNRLRARYGKPPLVIESASPETTEAAAKHDEEARHSVKP